MATFEVCEGELQSPSVKIAAVAAMADAIFLDVNELDGERRTPEGRGCLVPLKFMVYQFVSMTSE